MQKIIARVNLKAIVNNAKYFKTTTGARLCAVVKANAYGHGAVDVVNALSGVADFFAVALVEEGIEISTTACGKDILILTPPIAVEECESIIQNGFVASVGDLRTAKLLLSVAKRLKRVAKVHLKVNTGMNRYGMNASMLGKVCKLFSGTESVSVDGLYSHLYTTDEATSRAQRELFLQMQRIAKGYFPDLITHLSATYGATLGKEFAFDAVRIGLGLYGYTPLGGDSVLQKAMTVYARCELTRKYSFGGAGYGHGIELQKGECLSVLRVGYADGVLRTQANGLDGAQDNVNDCCMDVCLRKGRKGKGSYQCILSNAEQAAVQTGTIAYEILCAITKRAEIVYEWN
jgi:alanine racemase